MKIQKAVGSELESEKGESSLTNDSFSYSQPLCANCPNNPSVWAALLLTIRKAKGHFMVHSDKAEISSCDSETGTARTFWKDCLMQALVAFKTKSRTLATLEIGANNTLYISTEIFKFNIV